jgi:hypothetical protein
MSETLEQHLIRIRDYMVANPDADDHTVARALGTSTRFCHIAGRTYGVGKSFHATVRRKRYGLRPWQNPRGRQVMADELAEMRRMQAEGKTHVEIAAAVGKHPNTVWKRLNGWVSKRKATE